MTAARTASWRASRQFLGAPTDEQSSTIVGELPGLAEQVFAIAGPELG